MTSRTAQSLSEQGPPNHGTAAAGSDGDWLAGGPLRAHYSLKNVLFGAYCYYRTVLYSLWIA